MRKRLFLSKGLPIAGVLCAVVWEAVFPVCAATTDGPDEVRIPLRPEAVAATEIATDAKDDRKRLRSDGSSAWQRVLAALPKVSGYAQVGYIYQDDNGIDKSTFAVNRLRLILSGDISRVFDYRVQIEGFSSSKGSQNKALLSVLDAYVKAKVCPQFQIQVGQFPIPLTMENYDLSPLTLEVVNFSMLVNNMVCRNAVAGYTQYGRDCGIMASGGFAPREGFHVVNYNLAVFNGCQMNQPDDNKSKDIVARLTIKPLRDLWISGSFNWGEYVYRYSDAAGQEAVDPYVDMTRYAVGAWYNTAEGLMVRGEYGRQHSRTAGITEEMYYAIAGYRIAGKYMPLVRYDVCNDLENRTVGKQTNLLFGFLWTPLKNLKVQTDYTVSLYSSDAKHTGNLLQLMVIGAF